MSDEHELISVVIPLYNKAECIARAIDSVLAQEDPHWELWVVDDGSTDEGARVVGRYDDPRVRLLRQQNGGVSAARNAGVERAAGAWVAFLDADDHWSPGHLGNLRNARAASPHADMCATAYFVVDETGAARCIRLPERLKASVGTIENYFLQVLEHEHPIHSSAVMVRRSALLAMGGFPPGVSQGEDIIVWSTLACAGPPGYSGVPSAFYVAPPVSLKARPGALRRPQQPDPVATALHRLSARYPQQTDLPRFIAEWHRIRAMLFLERDERMASLRELSHAMGAAGVRLRDVVSMLLLLLPLGARQRALVAIRRTRKAAVS